jgi:hypothetical protein
VTAGLRRRRRSLLGVVATCAALLAPGVSAAHAELLGGSFVLPDNRAYELVSPVDKNGGDIGGDAVGGSLASGEGESSVGGSTITYVSLTSFGDAQSAKLVTQYLSSRTPSGWSTHGISPPAIPATSLTVDLSPPYRFFTPELTVGLLEWTSPELAAGAPVGFDDLYVHPTEAATYQLVTTVAPPSRTPENYEVRFAGASPDLSHVVFEANDALREGAPANARSVYEWSDGSLRLVSVLPGPGNVAAESAGAGDGKDDMFANDISADGSRIFWTDNHEQLYVREDGSTTVQLNASQRTPSLGDGSAVFRAATPDGSKVFFTDETPLTDSPQDNGGLYEYDFASGKLTDLSPDAGGAPGVEGVVGVSEDGLSVYFVASASLATGASPGANNLYFSHDGATAFIAALGNEDSGDWAQGLEARTARVTPDGEHLAFMSRERLTGYDNIDANTGVADAEVFEYDAHTGSLSCASCNPNGGPPIGPSKVPTGLSPDYIPRYISDDGQRVFFDSSDALGSWATNGRQNVYEYENGAVYPISSGISDDISTFSDASADGDDVFFTTRAPLVAEVQGESSNMYDARVDGGFPAAPAPPAQCTGEGCRGPLSAPPGPVGVATETYDDASEGAPAQPDALPKSKRPARKAKAKRPRGKSKARRSGAGRLGRRSRARRSGAGRLGRGSRARKSSAGRLETGSKARKSGGPAA